MPVLGNLFWFMPIQSDEASIYPSASTNEAEGSVIWFSLLVKKDFKHSHVGSIVFLHTVQSNYVLQNGECQFSLKKHLRKVAYNTDLFSQGQLKRLRVSMVSVGSLK